MYFIISDVEHLLYSVFCFEVLLDSRTLGY